MRHGVGDLVRLNSGGPQLLVVDVEDGQVVTAWRDTKGRVHEHAWPEACLTRLCRPPAPPKPGDA